MKDFNPSHDLNRTSLGEAVAARMGVSLDEGHDAVFAVLDTVAATLAGGYGVSVTNFGSWHPVVAPARRAHNPQTMEPVTVPESFKVKWTASPKMRAMVNGDAPATIAKDPKSF